MLTVEELKSGLESPLKFIDNSSSLNKETYNREEGLDALS